MIASDKISQVRCILTSNNLDAFIVGSEDAHQSEYVCETDMRRAYISGFTGSAGTALIMRDKALLWTDGRYFLQAEQELDRSIWTLMKSGEPNVPDLPLWVTQNLTEGQKVGIDPWLISSASAISMKKSFSDNGITLTAVSENIVDMVWAKEGSRPEYPSKQIYSMPISMTGVSHHDKISIIISSLKSANAKALVVTMLDEIAWLFNIRGADISFNPVAIAYAVVTAEDAILFIDQNKVSNEVKVHLGDNIKLLEYAAVDKFLRELISSEPGAKIWIDPATINWHLRELIGESALLKASPITLPKALKNEAEMNGIRNSHIRDGVALTAFLHWLETEVKANPGSISEYDVALKIEEFRAKMSNHVGPSFSTIAGYGPNGAIIHYKPESSTCRTLSIESLFLLDSGAQYKDGTTDVTRTVHFGEPTQHMKDCYTAVLKGHIGLATLIIPEGTIGSRFDSIARLALWRQGLDYNHGTGHGVGAHLNVHEGPQGIGFRKRENEVGFYPGMTISNEPGYYEDGAFGIRIENVCITKVVATKNNFGGKRFLGFETVTMTPIKTDIINLDMLDDIELDWLNSYHAVVRESLLPLMREIFPQSVDFLIEQTQNLSR